MLPRLVLGFALLAAATGVAAAAGPAERVRGAVDAILAVLENPAYDREARWARIGAVIHERFDVEAMSQSILATNWKRATAEEKRSFVEFFSQYLENTYRTTIESYTDEEIRIVDERIEGDRATVDTVVVTSRNEIPVVYRMRLNDGDWFAYDVVIEGVSLVSNYRNTFAAIVKSEGMQGLLRSLERSLERRGLENGDPQ